MKQVTATLGDKSAPTLVILFVVQAVYFSIRTVGSFIEGDAAWAAVYVTAVVLGVIGALMIWRQWIRGKTCLQWDGELGMITHGDRILFSGPVSSIDAVTEDGRGYFLHLDRNQQIRLRRRDVPRELAMELDKKIAQQAAASDRDKPLL